MRPSRWAGWGLALALAGAAPAFGDWLVTVRGERIETAGPWEVRGRQVVFTQTNGTLASVRLAEVDLNASRLETERAKAPPPPPPPPEPPKKAVLVLTDADVKKATPPPSAAQQPAGATQEVAKELEVLTWQEIEGSGNLDFQLMGELRNNSRDVVMDIKMTVRLLDAQGQTLATTQALLSKDSLARGDTTTFRAVFGNVYGYASVAFEPKGEHFRPYELNPSAAPTSEVAEEELE